MKFIEAKAQAVANELAVQNDQIKKYALDPFTISIIITIIINVIKLYIACNSSAKNSLESMKNLNILQRWRLKWIIKKTIDDHDMQELIGKDLFKSFLKVASSLNEEDVSQLYYEVENS